MKAKARSLGFAAIYAACVVFLIFVATQWAREARGIEMAGPLFLAVGAGMAIVRCRGEWKAFRGSKR